MEFKLRPRSDAGPEARGALVGTTVPAAHAGFSQLVADLIEATGLVPGDRLAAVRRRAGGGSLGDALVAEGVASSDGIARVLAGRYQLPLVVLHSTGVSSD